MLHITDEETHADYTTMQMHVKTISPLDWHKHTRLTRPSVRQGALKSSLKSRRKRMHVPWTAVRQHRGGLEGATQLWGFCPS